MSRRKYNYLNSIIFFQFRHFRKTKGRVGGPVGLVIVIGLRPQECSVIVPNLELEPVEPFLVASQGCLVDVDCKVGNEKDKKKKVDQAAVFGFNINRKEEFKQVDDGNRKNDQKEYRRQQAKDVGKPGRAMGILLCGWIIGA